MKTLIISILVTISSLAFALPEESTFTISGSAFSYYGSHSLEAVNESVKDAIIVVHGSERNADGYYKSIESVIKKFGKTSTTILVSVHYKLPTDKLVPGELTFTDEGWLSGDQSLSNKEVSSFEVMDHILALLGNSANFPALKKITVTGHSAGGQLTQRYALASVADKALPKIKFTYIVLNPGSYVYLTANRPLAVNQTLCPRYNDYKYGLENPNQYVSQLQKDELVFNYLNRQVIYLIGDKDVIAEGIDQTCPAALQGNQRAERAFNFKMQLDQEFPMHKHAIFPVPGVGHTQWGMYTSEIGSNLLFLE